VETKKDLVAVYLNIIDNNKLMMQREERNRFLLYKRPIDEAIKLKRQEKQAINESKNLSKLLDDHVG
jgi:hypothetical protein